MPKAIVSCRGKDGRNNALVVGYCGNCSFDPPMVMVGIAPSRFSHHLIKESGCLVINLPGKDFKHEYGVIGSKSGRDIDKFKTLGLKSTDGDVVAAPVLDDCPINMECKVVDSLVTGSHEMFICKVEKVHAPETAIGTDGKIDFSKLDLL
jgi:flavin reductase (DIM6/NTAB) family NADH-FMN oxidoreductase RutF